MKPARDFVDMDNCIGFEGTNLLGYPNEVVFLDFHKDRLYGVLISIHVNEENEKIEIVDALMKVLISTYGKGFLTTSHPSIYWLSDPRDPYSDKVILISKPDSIIVSFLYGDLYHQAHAEIKIKAMQKSVKRALGSD